MSWIINAALTLPLWKRAAVGIFVIIFLGWQLLRRPIFLVFSFIPLLIRGIFRLVYLLIETILSEFHKRLGRNFFVISNKIIDSCEKLDMHLKKWYERWHFNKKFLWKRWFLFSLIFYLYVITPEFVKINSPMFNWGWNTYLKLEAICIDTLKRWEIYDLEKMDEHTRESHEEEEILHQEKISISLLVPNNISSLAIRDYPSTETGTIVGTIKAGEKVTWTGEMIFAQNQEGQVRPWVKIVTNNGIEGWSSLLYLQPEIYQDVVFEVTN